MFGTVKGSRPKRRPVRQWADDIIEWAGGTEYQLMKAAENRSYWRNVSSMMHQQATGNDDDDECHIVSLQEKVLEKDPDKQLTMQTKHENRNVASSSNHMMTIATLQPHVPNVSVVGLIIAKQEPRSFPNKREPGKHRYLLSFTLRDSPKDMLNVTCWGDECYIQFLAASYHIGDIIEIHNPQIQQRLGDFNDERYKPFSSRFYGVEFGQNWGSLGPSDLDNPPQILVGEVKEILTKQGKHVSKLDVRAFDQTSMNFPITIWDKELIDVAKTWTPGRDTVFISDIKVNFDSYKKTMAGTCDYKTVFITSPETCEAKSLFEYAESKRNDLQDDDESNGLTTYDDITDVYTVAKLKEKLYDKSDPTTFYGVVYAFITSLDIDGTSSIIMTRCQKCRKAVYEAYGQCSNPECTVGMGADHAQNETYFQLFISLSDHTGSIHRCRMSGVAVEKVFGFTAMHSTLESERSVVRILDFDLANTDEFILNVTNCLRRYF
ncbi:Meiosis-specific with OB domain-containing protein [Nymphon striatum]|nr:Meiosis-specific with OB domain-containing protein [Nymphon striatum]